MLEAFIDTGALAKTVAAALVSGVGITLVFSLALLGAARSSEAGRDGRNSAALVYGTLGTLAGLAFVAAIVVGIIVMTSK